MLTDTDRTSPYQGLRNYNEEDSEFFFGRDQDRDVIVANLKANRLTVVYGPSGVGKSSLLRAGVEAAIRRTATASYARLGTPEFVPVVFSAWQSDPSGALIAAIATATESLIGEALPPAASLRDAIVSATSTADASLLVILDQFEELSLYRSGRNGADSFEAELPRLVNDRRLAVNFLISIREDALAQLDRFRHSIPDLLTDRLRVQPLSEEAAREAVTRPIQRYNELFAPTPEVTIEDDLVAAVLDQVRTGRVLFEAEGHGGLAAGNGYHDGQPSGNIETPYLQLVMETVWERETANGSHVLRRSTLAELGESEEIVRRHLDNALGTLPAEQRDAAVDVFDHLVTPSGTKIALRLPDLVAYSHRPPDQVEALVEALSSGPQRILRPVPPPPGTEDEPGVEIFHDVLAPAILAWRTRQSAERLEREKREADERARHERRRARLFTGLLVGAVLLLVIAIGAVVLAEVNRARADRAQKTAESRQLAAQAVADFQGGRLDRALLLSIEAYKTAHSAQARTVLVQGLEKTQGMVGYLPGQNGGVNAIAVSPNGRMLASGNADNTIALWDLATGRRLRTLHGHAGAVNAVAFDPAGDTLASGSADHSVALWDLATGGVVRVLHGHTGSVLTVAFDRAGRTVASGGADDRIIVWDSSTGRAVRVLRTAAPVNGVAFSPTGRLLASGQADGTVVLWDTATGRGLNTLHRHRGAVQAVSFSPDGSELASASADHTIRLWSTSTGRPEGVLSGHTAAVNSVAFSADGRQLVSGGADHAVALWDAAPAHLVRFVSSDTGSVVESVAFGRDGATIVSGGDAGSVVVWGTGPAAGLRTLVDPRPVYALAFSPGGRELAAANDNGTVVLWNLATGRLVRTLTGHRQAANGVAFSPDGRSLASSGDDGSVIIWDLASGRRRDLPGGMGALYALAFNRTGSELAAASAGGSVLVWQMRTGAVRDLPADRGGVYGVAFSPDGKTIASGGASGSVMLWDAATGHRLSTLSGHTGAVEGVAFSPDGKTLASGSDDNSAILWDPGSAHQLGDPLLGHLDGVITVAFSPNGKTVASASRDKTAVVWNLTTRLGQPLGGHSNIVTSVAFNPADGSLATGSLDRTVILFPSPPASSTANAVFAYMCSVVRHNLTTAEWHQLVPGRPYQRTCPAYQ